MSFPIFRRCAGSRDPAGFPLPFIPLQVPGQRHIFTGRPLDFHPVLDWRGHVLCPVRIPDHWHPSAQQGLCKLLQGLLYTARAAHCSSLLMIASFLMSGYPSSVPFGLQILYWFNLSNLVSAFHPFEIPALTHYWSLGIEEQFYFVWPLIVRKTRARGLAIVCLVVIGGCSLLRNLPLILEWNHRWFNLVYRLTPFRVDTLCAGALLVLRLHQGLDPTRLRPFAWAIFVTSVAGFIWTTSYSSDLQLRVAQRRCRAEYVAWRGHDYGDGQSWGTVQQ
jgi:hypothetical protein